MSENPYSSFLLKKYNNKEEESKWQYFWKSKMIYKWDSSENFENNFSIDSPPPTVSGDLHMGHVFSYCHADFIARFQRMKGKNVFYTIGFDDNGLPTERLVEKKKNIRAIYYDRSEFIKICNEVIEEEEKKYENLFNRLAMSYDWSMKYQTISPESRKISQMSFLDMVKKGYVYRSKEPILWDVVDQTAQAQADIEDKEKESSMNDIIFTSSNSNKLIISTTRPELLPACVAVLYNPEDERYKNLKDQYALTPLFKGKVPILEDENVDIEKGTGLVMCCTFGDTTDILWWKKHNLPLRELINKDGKLLPISFHLYSEDIPEAQTNFEKLVNLNIKDARKIIIEMLKEQNYLVSSKNISHTVKCAERSGAPLEIISNVQWFVKTIDFKDKLLENSSKINWHPKSMKIRLDNWINSVSWDWCISRQRYFGVPFPVWYSKRPGEEGKILYANKNQLPVDPLKDLPEGYKREEVEADTDVMDTWATSSITPQMASKAISKDFSIDYEKHRKLFPFDLRPQAHEIIRTWAFYTILKSHLHENSIAWSNIMISGWCLAEDKTKMSKSKGTVILPETLFNEFGIDAVRYWSASSRLGVDTAVCRETLKNGNRLVNKIWNASKFASQQFFLISEIDPLSNIKFCEDGKIMKKIPDSESYDIITDEVELNKISKIKNFREFLSKNNINENTDIFDLINKSIIFSTTDLWLLDKLSKTIKDVTSHFENYIFASAKDILDQFFWSEFCDNYLEIVKKRSYNEDGDDLEGQASSIFTLRFALNSILKLYAPFMPYVTESVFQSLFWKEGSVHSRNMWPNFKFSANEKILMQTNNIIKTLELIRKFKASKNLSIKTKIQDLKLDEKLSDISDSSFKDLQNVSNAILISKNSNLNDVDNLEESYEIIISERDLLKIALKI